DVGQIFLARDHTIRLCTPRAVSYISLLPQDVGRPLEHLTLKFDFPSLFAEINNVLADSEMQEYELQTHGGEWFRLRMSPFYGQTNECEGVVLSFVDIHRIKLAEERFRRLLVYSPDAMVVCSPSGEIMLVNEQTKRLFGYSARELEGRPVEILIPERFREAYPMHRASYMEKPSVRPMGTRAALYGIRADGSEVPIEVSLGTIEAEEGLLVVATFRDVTEFRFLETLQKNSNLILEQVVRGDPFEMVLTALVINVEQSCFGALCCVLSFEKDRRCLKTLVAPHLPEEYLQTINELRVGDGGDAFRELASAVKSVELADYAQHPANGNSCETSGGADRQTFSWVEPIVDTGGTRLGLFCMFPSEERELTQREHEIVNSAVFLAGIVMERRTREERMRQREEDLRHAHRLEAFGELAGGVAHEFNNLLQAIRGYIEFALETLPDETSVAGDLQMVNRAVERGMTLTRELLSLGRRQPLQRIYVDPAEFLEGTVKLLRPLLGNVIAVEQIVGEHLGTVHLDVAQFQQAILNLCINSRDAMPEGGTIAISLERIELDQKHGDTRHNFQIGRHLLMKITDTGTGIDPDVMERIFEPFFTTKEVGKGTGLGMPMVYSMVTQHGGGIYVESEPGSGTTVSIYLPAYDMPPTIRVEKELVVSVSGNGETILVAEDDALVAVMIQRILDRANYRVLLVQDGIEALEVFERHESEIDAAILDIIMPRLGGHAVAAKIRRRNPQLPIIFSTGYNPHSATVGRVADLKENLITKPYEPLTLLSLLRKVLDEKRTDTV
ncbi:MAG: ATP-binding protein, partial [Planctomycetaceae bacterium]